RNPETDFAALLEPLAGLESPGADLTPVTQILDQLELLVGRPDESVGSRTGSLQEPLDAAAEAVSGQFGKRLGSFTTGFIEQPGLRLAGAEEAVRQAITFIQKELRNHEHLGKELAARAANAHSRIKALLANVREANAS